MAVEQVVVYVRVVRVVQVDARVARELVAVLEEFGGQPAIKAVMKAIGIDCGPSRLPIATLPNERYDRLCARLEQIGFFTYCCKVNS